MSKAAAKRELNSIIDTYSKPWDVMPETIAARLSELTRIVYPNGIPLTVPRFR